MRLSRLGRKYYELQIATEASDGEPIPASGWEASFDRGETFVAATVLTLADPWTDTHGVVHEAGDLSTWLLAGPDADVGPAVAAVLTTSIAPLVRAIDSPEILIETAPRVVLH